MLSLGLGDAMPWGSRQPGGAEADADGGEERQAVRHGAAVLTDPLPADPERALLHAACRAAHVLARPGCWRHLLRGPLPQGGGPRPPSLWSLPCLLSPLPLDAMIDLDKGQRKLRLFSLRGQQRLSRRDDIFTVT